MSYLYELLEEVSNLIETEPIKSTQIHSETNLFEWLSKENYQELTAQQLAFKWDHLFLFTMVYNCLKFVVTTSITHGNTLLSDWLSTQDFVNIDVDDLIIMWDNHKEA